MRESQNKEFELRGVNHLALVCKDMERTVDFYSNVLGVPLAGEVRHSPARAADRERYLAARTEGPAPQMRFQR